MPRLACHCFERNGFGKPLDRNDVLLPGHSRRCLRGIDSRAGLWRSAESQPLPLSLVFHLNQTHQKETNLTISAYDKETGRFLSTLTDQDLQCLIDNLEEETPSDQDYYIDVEVIALLEEAGAPPSLLSMLKNALGDREGFEIRWERK